MRGQILNATAGNRGIILGENGSRYTFTPDEWGNSSFDAVPGMQVEFGVRGHLATDVRSLDPAPTYEAPSPPLAPSPPISHAPPPQAPHPYTPPQPPPLPRGPEPLRSALQHPVAAPGVSPSPRAGYPMSWRDITSLPEHVKRRKNCTGWMLILLGPISFFFLPVYLETPGCRWWHFLLGLIAFPWLSILWPVWVGIGVHTLIQSDEEWIKNMHTSREHTQTDEEWIKNMHTSREHTQIPSNEQKQSWFCLWKKLDVSEPKYCNTGECQYLPR